MKQPFIYLAVLFLTSCMVAVGPSKPEVVRDETRSSQSPDSVTIGSSNTFPDMPPDARRRTVYMASAGFPNDTDVYITLKSEFTQRDAYFERFTYIDQSIDQIRLGDRANIAIDQLIRSSERFGAELALIFENPSEAGVARVSLSLYCVQNSELIASSNQRRQVYSEAGGTGQAFEVATEAALAELIATYIRRVEQGGSCPQREFEER